MGTRHHAPRPQKYNLGTERARAGSHGRAGTLCLLRNENQGEGNHMIVFGTKMFFWGSALADFATRCGRCGQEGRFIKKQGMRFFTLYWIIPVIPLSGIQRVLECPSCKTRFVDNTPPGGGQPQNQPSPFTQL